MLTATHAGSMGFGMGGGPVKFARSASGLPDWTCPSCGNVNFADRDVCNMRKCSRPRPPENMPHAGMMVMVPVQSLLPGAYGLSPSGMVVGSPPALGRDGAGGWTCAQCQNVNFADRAFCNMRRCGAPRSESMLQAPEPGPVSRPDPKGGWICEICNSVNYADREICFMRKCGAVRPGLDGRIQECPVADAAGDYGGDWQCAECGNNNFADRAFCNMRKCQSVRRLEDWACAACGNKNFADRMHCNMRKCGAQRVDVHPKAVAALAAMGKGSGKGPASLGATPLAGPPAAFGGRR